MPTRPASARTSKSQTLHAKSLVVALGSFDGVHLGHQQILARTQALASELKGTSAVMTFEPLPAQLVHPDFTYVLTPLAEKTRLLTELGIEQIHVVKFDASVRSTEPEDFVRDFLAGPLHPAGVVVGHDHRFGRRGRGDSALLSRLLEPEGIRVMVVPEFIHLGAPVRSTRIREQLVLGAVGSAAELLGRYYALSGIIVTGSGTGRRLGFPTINLRPYERETLVPADGVYVAQVETLGRRFDAVLNIGHRPTFGGETRTIEAHLLDFDPALQPEHAVFGLIERLRPERRFSSPEALTAQIAVDVERARAVLTHLKPH